MIEYRTIADELREIVGSADTYYIPVSILCATRGRCKI